MGRKQDVPAADARGPNRVTPKPPDLVFLCDEPVREIPDSSAINDFAPFAGARPERPLRNSSSCCYGNAVMSPKNK